MLTVKEPKTGTPVSYEKWQDWRERRTAAGAHSPQCAMCWGAGKIYEMYGGRMQFPPVPCSECWGTGRDWRTL